jgi:hypothetical protein
MFVFSNPLRFDSPGDFASEKTTTDDIGAIVRMVVLTRGPLGPIQGEVPWDPDFGCSLDYYRHSRENLETTEITTVILEALKKGLPDVQVSGVKVTIAKQVMTVAILHSGSAISEVIVPLQ